MPLLSLVLTLIVIGVLLYLLNRFAGPVIDAKILQIINIVVVVAVVLYVLRAFGVWGWFQDIRIGR
jgi:hypothetical protein